MSALVHIRKPVKSPLAIIMVVVVLIAVTVGAPKVYGHFKAQAEAAAEVTREAGAVEAVKKQFLHDSPEIKSVQKWAVVSREEAVQIEAGFLNEEAGRANVAFLEGLGTEYYVHIQGTFKNNPKKRLVTLYGAYDDGGVWKAERP